MSEGKDIEKKSTEIIPPEKDKIETRIVEKRGEEVFRQALETFKGAHPKELIGSEGRYNPEVQVWLSSAEIFESVGDNARALELYERALEGIGKIINIKHPEQNIRDARLAVEGIARLKGNIESALNQFSEICEMIVAPENLRKIAGVEREQRQRFAESQGSRENLPPSIPELSKLIEILPDSPNSSEAKGEEAYSISFDVQTAIKETSPEAVSGFIDGAILAHQNGNDKLSQSFMEKAYLMAQIPFISMKKVMRGELSPTPEERYDSDSALSIAKALWDMGRFFESVKFALEHMGGNRGIWALSETVPKLLASDPKNPAVLELVKKFLEEADFLRSDLVVRRAIMKIVLILKKEYGFGEKVTKGLLLPEDLSGEEE